jgi:TatD DNase family protein
MQYDYIIDTHTHLDNQKFLNDADEVIKRAIEGGVKRFIIPGADPIELNRALELSQKYDEVYFAVGIHPYSVDDDGVEIDTLEETIFDKYASDPKCIAIGECGLDYFRLPKDEEEKAKNIARQKEIFIAHIKYAQKVNLPLIVHIRDASDDSKKILIDYEAKKTGGVLHCFNADEQLLSLADDGFYFGIGGVLTFKNAKKLINVLPKIPKDRLLIETDAPYLTPMPFRGERNEPLYTKYVASKMAEILSIGEKEIINITTSNAYKLFKI